MPAWHKNLYVFFKSWKSKHPWNKIHGLKFVESLRSTYIFVLWCFDIFLEKKQLHWHTHTLWAGVFHLWFFLCVFDPVEKPRMNNILTSQTEPYDLSFSRSFQNLTHLPPSYEMTMKADLSEYLMWECERERAYGIIHFFHV